MGQTMLVAKSRAATNSVDDHNDAFEPLNSYHLCKNDDVRTS